MSYIALYRKYRARSFDEMLGQKHVTQTLQNAVASGKFSHAYLFCGPRGCGKTSTARLLAKALNCEKGPTPNPCDQCSFCVRLREGALVDVVEVDAASETGIDNVRETIIENAKYPPMEARFKVYIIDEVHDLSAKAFDALLKTLEEPPAHVVFVLATTEMQKVPATIRSRCQLFQFHRGSIADLVARLKFVVDSENIDADDGALASIARMGDGSWRDSLTLLEQAIAFGTDRITLETVNEALGLVEDDVLNRLLDSLLDGDAGGVLTAVGSEMQQGREPRAILESLIGRLRELVFTAHEVDMAEWLDPHRKGALHEQAARIGRERLHRWWSRLSEAAWQLRTIGSPRVWVEIVLLDLAAEAHTPEPTPTAHAAAPPAQENPQPIPKPTGAVPPKPEPVQPGDPTQLEAAWTRMLQTIKQKSPQGAQVLAGARVSRVEGKRVIVSFPSELSFEKMQDLKRKRYVDDMLCEAIGEKGWHIRPELAAQAPPQEEDEPVAAAPPVEGEALVHLVREEFGGAIVDGDAPD